MLKPGGVFGAADLDASGWLSAGADDTLEEFLRLWFAWQSARDVDNRIGARLGGLLRRAGFEHVTADAAYESYGTPDATHYIAERFIEWFDENAQTFCVNAGIATQAAIDGVMVRLAQWGGSPESFAATAKANAVGWKPDA